MNGRGGRQDCEDYVEAALPVADRCDAVQNAFIMPERLAKTDPFKAINEVVGSGPYRFLKTSFSQAAAPRGEVRRLRAASGAGGMVQRRQRSPTFRESSGRLSRTPPPRRPRLQNGEVDWVRSNAHADLVPLLRRNSDIVIAPSKPAGLHRRPAVQLSSPAVR